MQHYLPKVENGAFFEMNKHDKIMKTKRYVLTFPACF